MSSHSNGKPAENVRYSNTAPRFQSEVSENPCENGAFGESGYAGARPQAHTHAPAPARPCAYCMHHLNADLEPDWCLWAGKPRENVENGECWYEGSHNV